MWDEKYSNSQFVYGSSPNDFLRENVHYFVPEGKILCIAEGEGRNAVWLAELGFKVTAVDASEVGLAKGRALAKSKGVSVHWVHADLQQYNPGTNAWDGVVAIFAHLPPDLRSRVHADCVESLKIGGALVLEAYTPEQLNFRTGGPTNADWLMTPELLQNELQGLTFDRLQKTEREIVEGIGHTGLGSVVQVIGRR
jgi:2-polyprenyl-3-methyl-5-hydroxy-6-metoxy-1,4-benzoquinol methylase|nr:class I SAM-dependent methyltransferase [uncultured Tolumonas sp.]